MIRPREEPTADACWKPCWADANPPDAADFRGILDDHGPTLPQGHGGPAQAENLEAWIRIRAVNPGTWMDLYTDLQALRERCDQEQWHLEIPAAITRP